MKTEWLVRTVREKTLQIDYETDDTKDGCTVRRFNWDSERNVIDFADDFKTEGWQQFDTDQDAHYFGVWFNPVHFLTLSYAEGDWTLVECHDAERYNRAIQRMIDFYAPGFIARVLDEHGVWTTYHQDRQAFFVATKEVARDR